MGAMAQPKFVGDAKIRALLETVSCPTPFHAVRARFMGNIASPMLSTSPIRTIEEFWPDGLPEFDSEEEAKNLMQGLLGLWNHLAAHQKRSKPFKLTIKPFGDDRASMLDFLAVRTEEIDQFLEGLLGGEDELPIPEDIHAEIELLSENYALMSATLVMLNRDDTTDEDASGLAQSLQELNKIAGVQINDIRWRQRQQRIDCGACEEPSETGPAGVRKLGGEDTLQDVAGEDRDKQVG